MLVNQTDNLIITYFQGLKSVGYVSNYTLLTNTLNTLITQFFNGITASVGNYNALEDDDKKENMFYVINFANYWLYGWGAIGIMLVASDLVGFLFGGEYILSRSISFALALNFYMVGMQNAVWTYKNTLGLFQPGRYLLILTAIINLSCSIWLGRAWGLFGIYIATAIARALTNAWYEPYAVFKYGLHRSPLKYFIRYVEYLLILLIVGVVSLKITDLFALPMFWKIIVDIVVCSMLFNISLVVCFYKRREFVYLRGFIEKIIKKILKKVWKK